MFVNGASSITAAGESPVMVAKEETTQKLDWRGQSGSVSSWALFGRFQCIRLLLLGTTAQTNDISCMVCRMHFRTRWPFFFLLFLRLFRNQSISRFCQKRGVRLVFRCVLYSGYYGMRISPSLQSRSASWVVTLNKTSEQTWNKQKLNRVWKMEQQIVETAAYPVPIECPQRYTFADGAFWRIHLYTV